MDVTIAHATVALLSLSRTPTADSAKDVDDITQLLETPSTPAATEYGHTGAAVAPIAETIALIRELVLPAQILNSTPTIRSVPRVNMSAK